MLNIFIFEILIKKHIFTISLIRKNMIKKYFVYTAFLIIPFLCLNAQTNHDIRQLPGVETYGTLSFVYGWLRNPKNDKWTVKEKEIKDIDKFDSYSIISFTNKGKKYIAILKQEEKRSQQIFDVYIIDYIDYVSKISLWEEHTILKFPILEYHQVLLGKKDIISMEALGLNILSDVRTYPRDNFVFQYKFFTDSTVKFLFYVESCSSDDCVFSGLYTPKEYTGMYENIGKDDLYNDFFYKTMLKYFTAFTDSPLNNAK